MKHAKRLLILALPLLLASCGGGSSPEPSIDSSQSQDASVARYVVDTYINEDNELIVVYNDGTKENKGPVGGGTQTPEDPTKRGTVTIVYDKTKGTVTPSKNGGNVGEVITLTIVPIDGYMIDEVRLNGSPLPAPYSFLLPEGENVVEVTFKEIPIIDPVDPEKETFDVIFQNYDGSVLYQTKVNEDQTAVYIGATPVKPSDERYDYVFDGWDKGLADIKENTILTATFRSVARKYKVTFLNYDGALLQESELEYGVVPTYASAEPTRPATATTTYTFTGWDKPLSEVRGEQVYRAVFTEDYAPTYRSRGLVFQIQEENASFMVKGYYGSDKEVVIPESFEGRPVVGILDEAFAHNVDITSLYLSASIAHIGENAFVGCEKLSRIAVNKANGHFAVKDGYKLVQDEDTLVYVLPSFNGILDLSDGVIKTIRSGALSCSHLQTLVAPGELIPSLGMFFGGVSEISASLHSVIISGGDVAPHAFEGCATIKAISFLNNDVSPTTRIGESAFKGCACIESLYLHDTVTVLGDECFANMPALRSLRLGEKENNLQQIGFGILSGTENIVGFSDYTYGATFIGNDAYPEILLYKTSARPTVYLPYSVKAVLKNAFKGNETVTKVDFDVNDQGSFESYSLLTLDDSAFAGAPNLADFTSVPTTVKSVGTDILGGTKYEDEKAILPDMDSHGIYLISPAAVRAGIDSYALGISPNAVFSIDDDESAPYVSPDNQTFYVQNGQLINRKTDTLVRCYDQGADGSGDEIVYRSVTTGVSNIGKYAFACMSKLTSVIAPNVKTISRYAFYADVKLKKVFAGTGLKSIGYGAFALSKESPSSPLSLYLPRTFSQELTPETVSLRTGVQIHTDYVDAEAAPASWSVSPYVLFTGENLWKY